MAQHRAVGAGSIYTCEDATGRRITSDRPIPQCLDRVQRVIGPTGVERQRLGPVLTEVEMAERREREQQEALRIQKAKEQRRKDAALLARYPDEKSHEAQRREAIDQVDELQALALRRLMALERSHFELQQEMEFYAKNPQKAPARLRAALEDSERAVHDQKRYIEGHDAEKRRIHKRFNDELERLKPLWDSRAVQ